MRGAVRGMALGVGAGHGAVGEPEGRVAESRWVCPQYGANSASFSQLYMQNCLGLNINGCWVGVAPLCLEQVRAGPSWRNPRRSSSCLPASCSWIVNVNPFHNSAIASSVMVRASTLSFWSYCRFGHREFWTWQQCTQPPQGSRDMIKTELENNAGTRTDSSDEEGGRSWSMRGRWTSGFARGQYLRGDVRWADQLVLHSSSAAGHLNVGVKLSILRVSVDRRVNRTALNGK